MIIDLIEQLEYEEITSLSANLTGLLNGHIAWLKSIERILLCRLPVEDDVVASAIAYRNCPIGKWYYSITHESLLANEEFVQIGVSHKKVHTRMHEILREFQSTGQVSVDTYDEFSDIQDSFFRLITGFVREIDIAQEQYDPLTKLLNRKVFNIVAGKEYSRSRRENTKFCFILADIDHFKQINATHGHEFGDKVLKALSGLLLEGIRTFDSLARYGGEEFVVCLPNTPVAQAVQIAGRLRKSITRKKLAIDDKQIKVTCSFGVAENAADLPVNEILAHADAALYQAKNAGRNRVIQWGSP